MRADAPGTRKLSRILWFAIGGLVLVCLASLLFGAGSVGPLEAVATLLGHGSSDVTGQTAALFPRG